MKSNIDRTVCLCLNKQWEPVGEKTTREAFIQITGSGQNRADGKPTDFPMNIEYSCDENGNPIFDKEHLIVAQPVSWEKWIELPIRPWDLYVTTPKRQIRIPTVIISVECTKMPIKKFKKTPSKDGIRQRDGGIDQYTGLPLKEEDMSIDHVIPISRGGNPNSWENEVLCHRDLNSQKGNRLNSEIGLKLIKTPTVPKSMPMYELIQTAKHADWNCFIKRKKRV